MKVLFLSPYITIEEDKEFNKNITGFGHMVRDIADYVSRSGVQVELITNSTITKGRKYGEFNILERTWKDILLNIKPYYFKKMIKLITNYAPSLSRAIKIIYYYLSAGYVEHVLKQGNYDIVHIHGVGFGTQQYIDCCERLGYRYLVTLHGLNSFSESVEMDNKEKQFEKDFLRNAYCNNVVLTVISTGILNQIKKYLAIDKDIENFYVVANGTNMGLQTYFEINIRQQYHIRDEQQIMLCVGNLGTRKNQLQIVRSYALITEEYQKKLCILFLGSDGTNGLIKQEINNLGLENNLILCSNISRDEIASYYQQADYTVLASISEGFGLSIIEGFVYGLPNLTFADLDAVEDIYDENAMLILKDRSDQALATGIVQMLQIKWDREYIKQYSRSFSLERMAEEYIRVYKDIVS